MMSQRHPSDQCDTKSIGFLNKSTEYVRCCSMLTGSMDPKYMRIISF